MHDHRQTEGSLASHRAVTPYSVCTSVGIEIQLTEQRTSHLLLADWRWQNTKNKISSLQNLLTCLKCLPRLVLLIYLTDFSCQVQLKNRNMINQQSYAVNAQIYQQQMVLIINQEANFVSGIFFYLLYTKFDCQMDPHTHDLPVVL